MFLVLSVFKETLHFGDVFLLLFFFNQNNLACRARVEPAIEWVFSQPVRHCCICLTVTVLLVQGVWTWVCFCWFGSSFCCFVNVVSGC